MIDTAEVLSQLDGLADIFEAYHRTSFLAYRNTKDSGVQTLEIEILDKGPSAGDLRYSCKVTTDDGKQAAGNPAARKDVALAIVHWQNLDVE